MCESPLSFILHSPGETARFASALAPRLGAGDTILLSGPVGAGKTHFARQLIASLQTTPEDIPSPTFTLVQTYDTAAGPVWHADLYRITSTCEIEELGLPDAFEEALCIVEWPDRLGDLTPPGALNLEFSHGTDEETRNLTATWNAPRWRTAMNEWARL